MNRQKTQQELRSEAVVHWFDTHPCFNVGTMCNIIRYDRSNFAKRRALKYFPDHWLSQIENQLSKYGFTTIV